MPPPTFLCIGAQKCGTTWLATAVQQHPGVATGVKKELHFFNHEQAYARGLGWYEEQFRARPQTRAIGEFTPNYWWTAGTTTTNNLLGSHDRVADAYPDLQLVVCLRDPVDRAVSAYFHHMNVGRFGPSVGLLEAVERYPDIREFGLYATQLAAWRSRYAAERFLVLTYEDDIRPDAAKPRTLRRVYRHLGVCPASSRATSPPCATRATTTSTSGCATPPPARAPCSSGCRCGCAARSAGRSPSPTETGWPWRPTCAPR